ncbi:MAG TPA: hypothetical protein VOA78_10185 [Candidatus Dormibacteraeota bacterium]|nr:hypothetical protein [Candidatus Dormibacteraeota bacterium]
MYVVAPLRATSLYLVEVSGWDAAELFFVEKAELEWNEEGDKRLVLGHELRAGAILFVRLVQAVSPERSHPVPYVTEAMTKTDDARWQFRLTQVQPQDHRAEAMR